MRFRSAFLGISSFIFFSFLSAGCSWHAGYLTQAALGQFALENRAQPLSQVVQDERTPPRVRTLLSQIPKIKAYGEANGLKPTANYENYVKLDREMAVWVVSACESLKFKPKEWSFPIVGSFPYLGWFDKKDANRYADELKKQGWDVDVRGARAYSTVGWFKDSILSSMILKGEEALGFLVNIVLHESTHATLYLSGQAHFNETLAEFVGDELTLQYMAAQSKDSERSYLKMQKEGQQQRKVLYDAYAALDELYQSSLSDSEKLQKKEELLDALQEKLKTARKFNNASLLQYKTYHTDIERFQDYFSRQNRSWEKFWLGMNQVHEDWFKESQQKELKPIFDRLLQ